MGGALMDIKRIGERAHMQAAAIGTSVEEKAARRWMKGLTR